MTLALVLFDLDDTLCDYGAARDGRLRAAFRRAFAASGGIDDGRLDELVAASIAEAPHGGDHFPALLARHGLDDAEAAEGARRWFSENRFLGLELFPDAVRLLGLARGVPTHGVQTRGAETRGAGARRVGLVTNGPAEVQRAKIDLLELWGHVDFAVISGELGAEKPDPAIFREALRLGGARAAETVYVGDSPHLDVVGARSVGIRTVWVNAGGDAWPADLGAPPDAVVRHVGELEGVLDALAR